MMQPDRHVLRQCLRALLQARTGTPWCRPKGGSITGVLWPLSRCIKSSLAVESVYGGVRRSVMAQSFRPTPIADATMIAALSGQLMAGRRGHLAGALTYR